MADETCRTYEVDGQPVVVRGQEPLNEQDQAALAELVTAAKTLFDQNPNAGIAQDLIAAARLASWCIPDGMTGARFRMVDGTEVKKRLREAVKAAQNALGPAVAESVHPGEILREELAARGLTQTACAEKIGRRLDVINRIIKGKKTITADTALDLEQGLGISAEFWVRLQAYHDLHLARQRRTAGRQA